MITGLKSLVHGYNIVMVFFILFYVMVVILMFSKFAVKIFDRFKFERKRFWLCLMLIILAFVFPYVKIQNYKLLLTLGILSLILSGIILVLSSENFGFVLIKIISIAVLSQIVGYLFFSYVSIMYAEFWFGFIMACLAILLLNRSFESIGVAMLGQLIGVGILIIFLGTNQISVFNFIISTVFTTSILLIYLVCKREKIEKPKPNYPRITDFIDKF